MSQYVTFQDQTIAVGDSIAVHQKITEGNKVRTQIFEGLVIAIKGRESGRSMTVRKIGAGAIGVEKILPLHLPSIEKILVKRHGQIKRAKLYYLRDRVGKAASKIKEKNTFLKAEKKA
jgi:large subunit ribosomal protein L19